VVSKSALCSEPTSLDPNSKGTLKNASLSLASISSGVSPSISTPASSAEPPSKSNGLFSPLKKSASL
jgi:hypothetical protein